MKRLMQRHPGRPSAFTLVELLVVIGIIAVLIAILLPALSRARDSANTIACLSNMRQLVMYTQYYTSENRDYFPFCQLDTTNTKPGRYGMVAWWDYMLTQQGIPHVTWQDWAKINDPGSKLGILVCPASVSRYWSRSLKRLAWPGEVGGETSTSEPRFLIRPNSMLCPRNDQWGQPSFTYYPQGDPGRKTAEVKRQSQIMLVVDNDGGDVTSWAGGWDPAMHLRYRHQQGEAINIGYVDGHAETVHWSMGQDGTNKEYDYNLRAMGGNCLPWTDPEYKARKQ